MKLFLWFKRTFYQLLFGANLFIGLLTLLVYLASYIAPSSAYILSVLALGYPYLVFTHLLFIIFWIYKRKRFVYLSLFILVIGFQHLYSLVGLNFLTTDNNQAALSIMSYNVRYFNVPYLNNESDLMKAQNNIFDIIKANDFDIFCGQEFSGKSNFYNQRVNDFMEKELGLQHSCIGGGSSLSIYSRYPVVNSGKITFDNSFNGAIYADIQFKASIIRIYCIHLQSVGLGKDENELFDKDNLTNLSKNTTQVKYKRIHNKLKMAFLKREEQALRIKEHMQSCPYPYVLAGDLNDTPSSYAYAVLSDNMQDAFTERGLGVGSTYAGLLPFLRIDGIFYSNQWKVLSFETLDKTSSDHYPIVSKAIF